MVLEVQKQLDQIEAQKQVLLEQQKQLEREARYGETLQKLHNKIASIKASYEGSNKAVKDLFDKLQQEEEIKEIFTLEERVITQHIVSYYLEDIKEEDKINEVIISQLHIKSKFGAFYPGHIEKGKVRLPYGIATQYRFYKFETVVQKIKEAIEREERGRNSQNKLERTKEALVSKFSNLYPGAVIKAGDRSIKNYSNSYTTVPTIKIIFKNTSEVVLRYYEDGSYGVIEKLDHRVKSLKGDDLIFYLAS